MLPTSLTTALLPGVPPVESPLFDQWLDHSRLDPGERAVAQSLHDKGYAVIDFPDPEIDARVERIKAQLTPRFPNDSSSVVGHPPESWNRIQDAWKFDKDVRAVATNPQVLALLEKLYGRRAVPFQTLNFPVGTQQHLHSDSIHFSCVPERFMCGVWLALEDVHEDAGPLEYCPGSHRWPIVSNVATGLDRWNKPLSGAQEPYEPLWRELVAASGFGTERFAARKGQALIWAANLLHGGSPRKDPTRTRWSQVSHYYFADCIYYTPAFSDEPIGHLHTRSIINIATGAEEPNRHLGKPLPRSSQNATIGTSFFGRLAKALGGR